VQRFVIITTLVTASITKNILPQTFNHPSTRHGYTSLLVHRVLRPAKGLTGPAEAVTPLFISRAQFNSEPALTTHRHLKQNETFGNGSRFRARTRNSRRRANDTDVLTRRRTMATRDCTGAPATRELTALPSAVRPCLGGRRWRARPAAMTTLETLKTEGHRARAPPPRWTILSEGGGGRTLCTHTHFVVAPSVFLLLYYARRARSRPPHAPRARVDR